jgi:hypothetical protein
MLTRLAPGPEGGLLLDGRSDIGGEEPAREEPGPPGGDVGRIEGPVREGPGSKTGGGEALGYAGMGGPGPGPGRVAGTGGHDS